MSQNELKIGEVGRRISIKYNWPVLAADGGLRTRFGLALGKINDRNHFALESTTDMLAKNYLSQAFVGSSIGAKRFLTKSLLAFMPLMCWAAQAEHCAAQVEKADARPAEGNAEHVDYRQQIQPILARDCYACHGPDAQHREAGLRLDIESEAKTNAIVAGDADSSPLIERIFETDADVIMPPPETGHQLTETEKSLLRRWIDQGAAWQNHWAFEPIVAPAVPPVDSTWPANEIDHFVLKQQELAGLTPGRAASKATLLRRVHLDLVGLPPTPQQVSAFLADNRENAYELVVDELLASPHYGEQMAVGWLDLARYADTNGYQNDFNRTMWPWRDWVIKSFNENLPYDQFIVQQIAGDMLPSPTDDQLIATGFNRNNRSVTEGGAIEEEWRIENCVDRVETTSAAFLGLTMGCCRCHDHKYDPISQKEFFEFFAFFNNIDEQGVYNEARGNVGPQIPVRTEDQARQLAQIEEKLLAFNERYQAAVERTPPVEEVAKRWRAAELEQGNLPEPIFRLPAPVAELVQVASPVGVGYRVVGKADPFGETKLPDDFQFERDVAFSWSAWLMGDSRGSIFGQMNEDNAYRGVDAIVLADGRLKVHLIHQWTGNALAVISQSPLPSGHWTCLTVTYDGHSKAAGLKVYFDGHPVPVEVSNNNLSGTVVAKVPFKIGQRSKSELFTGVLSDFQIWQQVLTAAEVRQHVETALHRQFDRVAASDKERTVIQQYLPRYLNRELLAEQDQLLAEQKKLSKNATTSMVMRERAEYRKTYLLKRGQYDQPDESEALMPAVPRALPPLEADQPRNRLGLAKWMVDLRNPLVPRVVVNRAWSKFFGRGLVTSPDNFGLQGDPPTHPALLDWLAHDFRDNGWNLKRLHKKMVMSATYRQASELDPAKVELDPENKWLSRAARFRLSAEQVRDQALSVSGLLTMKIGGPSVYPYQPEGLWEELAGGASGGPYRQSTGEGLYRRSLYTFRKRTVSHPTLSTFDAPSWEICQVKRSRTNTPLQALALLNDTTYVESARRLAERMIGFVEANPAAESSDNVKTWQQRAIVHGFELVTQRKPSDRELEILVQGHLDYFDFYSANAEESQSLIELGGAERSESIDNEKLAAMTSVAMVLLNLDETISRQ